MQIKLLYAQLIVFFFVLFSCIFVTIFTDDIALSNIDSLSNHTLIAVNKLYYLQSSGRLSATFLALLLFGKQINFIVIPLLNILSAILFVYFVTELCKISFRDRTISTSQFSIFALFFIFYLIWTMAFFDVVQWKSGIIVYFIGDCLALFSLSYLFALTPQKNQKKERPFLFFIIGLILGTYNEITVTFILAYCFLFYINMLIIHKKWVLPGKSQFTFCIGNLLGLCIILLSPGTWHRKEVAANLLQVHHKSLAYKISFAFEHYFYYENHLKFYLAIFILSTIIGIIVKNGTKTYSNIEKSLLFQMLLFLLCMLILSTFAYTYEGAIVGRVTFIYDTLLFIMTAQSFLYLTKFINYNWIKHEIYYETILAACLTLSLSYLILVNYPAHVYLSKQLQFIEAMQDKSEQSLIVYADCNKKTLNFDLRFGGTALFSDPTHWVNATFARYYGVKSVIAGDGCTIPYTAVSQV